MEVFQYSEEQLLYYASVQSRSGGTAVAVVVSLASALAASGFCFLFR